MALETFNKELNPEYLKIVLYKPKKEKIGNISVNHEKHFALLTKVRPNDVMFREPLNPSLDGNTVEMAVEQMEFSENVVRYQTTLQFLTNKISGLMSAIKGE